MSIPHNDKSVCKLEMSHKKLELNLVINKGTIDNFKSEYGDQAYFYLSSYMLQMITNALMSSIFDIIDLEQDGILEKLDQLSDLLKEGVTYGVKKAKLNACYPSGSA